MSFNSEFKKLQEDLIKIIEFDKLQKRLTKLSELHNEEIRELGGYER